MNVASQLEAASDQLGLWILLSNYMVKLCDLSTAVFLGSRGCESRLRVQGSDELLSYFRMVDNVMLEGRKELDRHRSFHLLDRLDS